MKHLLTLFFLAAMLCCAQAQPFQELCPTENTNGTVVDFEHYGNTLYATGFFSQLCGNATSYMGKWESEAWQPTDIPLGEPGHSLEVIDGLMFIGRYQESIDSNWVFVYDGENLEAFGQGVYLTTASGFSELPNIYDVIAYEEENTIVACGEFDRVGEEAISGIMQWNGNQWIGMGGGLSGNIPNTAPVMFPHQLAVIDGALYVVGNFRFAGEAEVNGIAVWNADLEQWEALGDGFNGTVYSITQYDGQIWAGGAFTQSGGQQLNALAVWNADSESWVSPGFGFVNASPNDFTFVHTLEVIEDTLYLAGGLKQIELDDGTNIDCGGIVSYDGTNLNTFEGGVSGNDIEAIAKDEEGHLLIGGGVFNSGYLGIQTTVSAIEEAHAHETFSIYPNPVKDQLHIQLATPATYQIINANGKIIQQGRVTGQASIGVAQLPAGLYTMRVQLADVVKTKKWLKVD
jgi:hypothetical protein